MGDCRSATPVDNISAATLMWILYAPMDYFVLCRYTYQHWPSQSQRLITAVAVPCTLSDPAINSSTSHVIRGTRHGKI